MAVCSRCGNEAAIIARAEDFCRPCFEHFIELNVHRPFHPRFRVDYTPDAPSPPLVVVAMSYGINSLAMALLVEKLIHRHRAKNAGRQALRALCVHVGTDRPSQWPFEFPLHVVPPVPIEKAGSLRSRSSRQDLEQRLVRQVVTGMASKLGAVATLWGHSMTRLSEMVLAETVKGRGANIPQFVGDSDTTQTETVYPMRPVTGPEITEYMRGFPDIETLALQPPVPPGITKLQSIDEIVHSYFEGVQTEFPAVVSTVARVASKLAQPPEICVICTPEAAQNANASQDVLCYGCRVMLDGQAAPSKSAVDDILAEYEL